MIGTYSAALMGKTAAQRLIEPCYSIYGNIFCQLKWMAFALCVLYDYIYLPEPYMAAIAASLRGIG